MRMKHGHSQGGKSPEWNAWQNMIQRCTNKKFRQYKDYGGRGISVFPGWLGTNGFSAFLAEVGLRPSPAYTLDRKENDKNYEPGNVRWATRIEQNNNTSKNVWLTAHGQTRTLSQWSVVTGIAENTLRHRLRKLKWPPERALDTPLRRYSSRRVLDRATTPA